MLLLGWTVEQAFRETVATNPDREVLFPSINRKLQKIKIRHMVAESLKEGKVSERADGKNSV